MRPQAAHDTDSGSLRVSMFGALRIVTPSSVLTARDFPGAKPRQLLEVLLSQRGHTVSKSRLAELLWGESMPRDHVAALETYVSVLRRTLAPGQAPARSVVVTEHGGYRIGPAGVEVDLDLFDGLRHGAQEAADQAVALDLLRQALDLVAGPVLEHEPYAVWAEPVRTTYAERYEATLVDAGRLALVLGEAAAARDLAQRAVALNPLGEPAYQVLMTASYALQRQDEALQAFDQCRRLLDEELGVDPVPATVALHLGILHHEPAAQLVPELGAGPVRAGIAATAPATAPVPAPAGTSLLGRERELALLQEAVARARAGRLTVALVTGPAGIGKTLLVEHLARACDLPLAANRCSDLETRFPYLALSLALQPLLPGSEQLVERAAPHDQVMHLSIMEDFAGRLREQSPLLLWLDDAQWADPATIATLGYLQRRCPEAPVLVVLTGVRSRAALEAVRAVRPDVRLDLGPLTQDCVNSLGHDQLFDLTGGHPLYVDGWLRARREASPQQFGPELCERVLMSCWDAGPHGYQLLSAAASLDRPTFSPALLAGLVDAALADVVDELDALVEVGLLRWEADQLAFSTPALREILASALSPARRAAVLAQTQSQQPDNLPFQRAAQGRRSAVGHRPRLASDVA